MGRFKVSITKLSVNLLPPSSSSMLCIDVKSATTGDDIVVEDTENNIFTTLTVFNILEPQAKYIRVEALNDFTSIFQSNSTKMSNISSKPAIDENKIVQILHKRKSIGGVSPIMFSHIHDSNVYPVSSDIMKTPNPIEIDCNSEDEKFIQVNVKDLKYGEMITIMVNALSEKLSISNILQNQDTNNNASFIVENDPENEAGSSIKVDPVVEAGGPRVEDALENYTPLKVIEKLEVKKKIESNIEKDTVSEPKIGNEILEETNLREETLVRGDDDVEPISLPVVVPHTISSHELQFSIANVILITLEIDPNPDSSNNVNGNNVLNTLNKNLNWTTPIVEPSEESVVEPGTILDFPWPNKNEKEKVNNKKIKQKEKRSEVLKTLIYERLLAFGLSYDEAYGITDTWNTGYVQQRACSYRVPKGQPKWFPPPGLNPTIDIQLKSEAFAYDFLRHLEILQGTLDGATCTVIETTFFLMLPHLKMSASHRNSNLLESLTSVTFVKDWIQVIFTAAHQLKPSEPKSVSGIIEKETKLLRKLLKNVKKVSTKIKRKFRTVQTNIERLRKKVFNRIEPNPEWTADILERNKKAKEKLNGSIQTPEGLTASNLFENYIHVSAGRKGLVIKRHLSDPWVQFSNLNFLERRVIFLGLTDHMYSTFDTILCTFRHLQELYTPGYPLNIMARINALFELLYDKVAPYNGLTPQTRSLIYSKTYALSQSVDRFCHTFSQLSNITKEAGQILNETWYTPGSSTEYVEAISQERLHINLVVPFTTLCMNGLTELKLRGRGLPHEKATNPESTEPPPVENEKVVEVQDDDIIGH